MCFLNASKASLSYWFFFFSNPQCLHTTLLSLPWLQSAASIESLLTYGSNSLDCKPTALSHLNNDYWQMNKKLFFMIHFHHDIDLPSPFFFFLSQLCKKYKIMMTCHWWNFVQWQQICSRLWLSPTIRKFRELGTSGQMSRHASNASEEKEKSQSKDSP